MSEISAPHLVSVAEGIEIIDAIHVQPRAVRLPLADSLGLRLASDIAADRDDPPFDKSQMDGFGVRVGDGSRLRVVGEIMAGASGSAIRVGEAVAIMTGAPIPPGADAVVPVEQTSRDGDFVRINQPPQPGQSIARRGSECRAGQIVLKKGTRLGPAQVGVAASVGATTVSVFARPSVAVLSTGDELVEIHQTPEGAQIRNSNSYMLVALLRRLNCEVTDLGIVRDVPETIRTAIHRGMQHDVLFVTGGMSMGERDYVPSLLPGLGLTLKISKVRIKPGKPFIFAEGDGRFVFGLPGNPVSAFVCTLRFASRLLRRLAGDETVPSAIYARLKTSVPTNGPREFYQPAILEGDAVAPLNWQSSADIYTLASANALIVRPEHDASHPAGDRVEVILIPEVC